MFYYYLIMIEGLLTKFWVDSFFATPILVVVSVLVLYVVYKAIKALVGKYFSCPLNRACKYVTTKLWVKCGCKDGCCSKGKCTKGACLPVRAALLLITVVLTLIAFWVFASFFGLTWVSAILTAIVAFIGSVLAWVFGLVKTVLLLIPQATAVYLAGRSIYKGPQHTLEEVTEFVKTNVVWLFNGAKDALDDVSDTLAEKVS